MQRTTAAPSHAQRGAPLINRDFALLFSGQAISVIGDMMFTTTLVLWIATGLAAHFRWAPTAVSGVLLAAAAPALLIGPLAGVFVDRADKRRMMLWMDGLRVVIVAALIGATGVIALPFTPGGRLPLVWSLIAIYAVVALVNLADQFFRPSVTGLIQDVVPADQQPKAIGLSQAAFSIALILGPSLAAPLYALSGPTSALVIDAVSFGVSYLTILAIRARQRPASATGEARSFRGELWEGIRFYFSNRALVTLLLSVVVAILGASAISALDVFFATDNLHATTAMYGLLGGVFGLGSIIGSIAVGLVARRLGLARTLWVALALFGLLIVALSRVTSYDLALGLFGLAGILNASLSVAAGPMMMRETPPALIGRVMSIFQPAASLATVVGTAVVGYLAGVALLGFHAHALGMSFTSVDTIWLCGGVVMFMAGVVTMIGMRGVDARYHAEDSAAAAAAVAAPAKTASAP